MSKVALLILDGWGHGNHSKSDGIYHAKTPFIDQLEKEQPNAELVTYGKAVGLPEGQMGNSEVGHLNIGAGRIVYQELTRINHAVETGTFQKDKTILNIFDRVKKNGKKLHFMGLVSDGGVHSSQEHLFELCKMAKAHQVENVFVHAFTDGRDCDPHAGIHQIEKLSEAMAESTGKIATLTGRYYAMDRDNRWERVKLAYDAMVNGVGEAVNSASEAIAQSYEAGVSDEFITPKIVDANGMIEEGDSVICFNFRTDRCREISTVLTQSAILGMEPLNIDYTTMTNYDHSFKNVNVIFEKDNLVNTLGEIVANAGLSQVRIAETEKYPHVTFFFSGGREKPFKDEKRLLINSPKVATYDLQPSMSAPLITQAICDEMEENEPDFICLNFANTDMVGHTGVYEAILAAAETVDECARTIVNIGQKLGYDFIIIADHGNSDFAINADGTPNTAHSLNPVPIIVLSDKANKVKDGSLRDVAPTVLDLLGIHQPEEMTGTSVIVKD